MISISRAYLVDGDPLRPGDLDLIAQAGYLAVGEPVPDGWRVLTGNERHSLIARIAYRHELADDSDGAEDEGARFLNFYECTCGTAWEDEWSCACDDRCPTCDTPCSPHDSEEIRV